MAERKRFFIVILLLWAVQMAAAFYFCAQKQGFHEDEYYTYYATARTNGFYVEDGRWMDRETYRNEFVVLPGERFQYGLVKLVQSWDVHPPVYYWVFHTVASLVPGVFSKWIGLSVNLFFHGINVLLLTYLSYLVSGRDGGTALLVSLFFGLSPAAMSGVVFIRMYELLTTFVLLCAVLHVRVAAGDGGEAFPGAPGAAPGPETDEKRGQKLPFASFLLPMTAVTYLGFLTQYYYAIFLFYLAVAFGAWLLWRDRKLGNCIRYGISQGIALLLAYLTYPSCLGQMFRGQRGAQATANFFDLSNTLERVAFFWDLLNRYVFGHTLPVLLLAVILLGAAAYQAKRRGAGEDSEGPGAAYWMLLFAAGGYFLTVSKTALLLGETSNRYQLPVYGIIVLLVFAAVRALWRRACAASAWLGWHGKQAGAAAVLICLAVVLAGHWQEDVVFLYPEDAEQTAYAGARAAEGVPAVYLYQPGAEWCVWDVADELFAYPAVCFAAAQGEEMIVDSRLQTADSLVVYLAEGADAQEQIGRLFAGNPGLTEYECVFEEKYCGVFYVH
ncbi:MAG: hypothetical protein NC311_17625 [Muribaculaceae bacterium]|nr:hypothetical protein [Muribaculaceae bacterium]